MQCDSGLVAALNAMLFMNPSLVDANKTAIIPVLANTQSRMRTVTKTLENLGV